MSDLKDISTPLNSNSNGETLMTKFVYLHEVCGNDLIKPLLINVSHIQHVQVGSKGKDTHIRLSDKSFFFVQESFDEVKNLIVEAPAEQAPSGTAAATFHAAISNMVGAK